VLDNFTYLFDENKLKGKHKTSHASEMCKETFPSLYCSEDALPLRVSTFRTIYVLVVRDRTSL